LRTVLYRRRIGVSARMPLRIEYYALKGTGQCDHRLRNQEGFAKAIQAFVLGVPA